MTPDPFRRCLILTGPTGSGKSAVALDLAQHLDAEIVCMDSMTVYRGMDVGTAKPSAADRARVPHHLLDVLDPSQSANVAWWLGRAEQAVRDIESRGRQALIVGGTAMYLKALLHGLFDGPPADPALRQRLESEPPEALHARLTALDPVSAARIHPNNVRRVVRALEVRELTGRPLSDLQQQWQRPAPLDDRCLCLDLPREELYARIDARVARMFEEGLIDEVRRLRHSAMSREAAQALGYKELFAHLDGTISREQALEEVRTRTRQFAKRQLTWFRHLHGVRMASAPLTFSLWASRMDAGPAPRAGTVL
jgi:tRNA dimethylallyltransferase